MARVTEAALQIANTELASLSTQVSVEDSGVEKLQNQIAGLIEKISVEMNRNLENKAPEVSEEAVKEFRRTVRQQRQALDAMKQKRAELDAQLETLRGQASKNKEEMAAAAQMITSVAEELEKKNREILVAEEKLKTSADKVFRAAVLLGSGEALPIGEQAAHIKKMLKDVVAKDQRNEELGKAQTTGEDEKKLCEEECTRLQNECGALEKDHAGRKVEHDTAESLYLTGLQKLNEDTDGIPAAEVLQQILQKIEGLQAQEILAKTAWEKAEENRGAAMQANAAAKAALEQRVEQQEAAERKLKQEMEAAEFTGIEAVKAAFLPIETVKRHKKDSQEFREIKIVLTAERDRLKTELGDNCITDNDWAALQLLLASAEKENKEQNQWAIETAQTHRELSAKHQLWNRLQSELGQVRQQADTILRLENLIKGRRMVDFMATEQMEEVVSRASVRLTQLTQNRYALELGSDGSFLVRDDANGGGKRAASSLSGGETFQTSLALALALSDQIQLRGKYPLEFFFLDEGFGSLDRSTLDISMSTLERLRHERLTIGIISHVEELQQRMLRRLMVKPPDDKGHGSRVTIEIA